MPAVAHGWDFWRAIGSPRHVCAPMVDQSELAFRMLARQLGTQLCYTPMLHSRIFTETPVYRALHFDPHPRDTPTFGQLAGHDPRVVLKAARMIESEVEAVDLNFGCPQAIARKGRYGAFLLDEPEVMLTLVSTLHKELSVPVTAKLRLLPSLTATVDLCLRLQEAGASVLCVHGRTREQNKQFAGAASWDAVAAVVAAVDVPVIANGGIGSFGDASRCLEATGAAAVMSSEALLENPALFCANRHPADGRYLDQDELASMYVEQCLALHPDHGGAPESLRRKRFSDARSHLFKMLHNALRADPQARDGLLSAQTLEDLRALVQSIAATGWEQPMFHTGEEVASRSWYHRHRKTAAAEAGPGAADTGGRDVNAARADMRARAAARAAQSAGAAAATTHSCDREQMATEALERRGRRRAERARRRQFRKQGRGVVTAEARMPAATSVEGG